MKGDVTNSIWRKAIAFITAFSLILGSTAPAYAQSFKDIIGGGNRSAAETKSRKMTPEGNKYGKIYIENCEQGEAIYHWQIYH